jgi:hypothetical protein
VVTHGTANGLFLLHYCEDGTDGLLDADVDVAPANGIPDALDDIEEGLGKVWDEYVVKDGWRPPVGDEGRGGDDRLDVYIRSIEANGYAHAETTPLGYTAYLEINHKARGFGSLTLQSIAGHELHHALQFAVTTRVESWVYEATATWVQYTLFKGTVVMDVARNVLWAQRLAEPHRALADTGDRFEYAGMVWFQFLMDHGGAPRSALGELWEEMGRTGEWEAGHSASAQRFGLSSLEDAAETFAEWNLFACHRDDGYHYRAEGLPCTFEAEVPAQSIGEFPAMVTTIETGRYGASYVDIQPDCMSQTLRVRVDGPDRHTVRVVNGRAAGGSWSVRNAADFGPADLDVTGWNDHLRTVVAIINDADVPQVFTVTVDVDGTYAPNPSPDGALWIEIVPKDEIRLGPGETRMVQARGRFLSCADDADISGSLQWVSSDTAVVQADDGQLKAVAAGAAEVRVSNGVLMSEPVRVTVQPTLEEAPRWDCSSAGGLPGNAALLLVLAFMKGQGSGRRLQRRRCDILGPTL